MKEIRLALNERLSQLQMESELIDGAKQEIQRRFGVLDDVEAWGLLPEADGVSPAFGFSFSEVTNEEGLDLVNAEREEGFEFAVSGEFAAE